MRNKFLFACAACAAARPDVRAASADAQTTKTPTDGQTAPATPPPPPVPRQAPKRNLLYLRGAVATLDRVMADLQRGDEDYNGHRQAALDACTKAREELAAIAKEAGVPLLPPRAPGSALHRPPPPSQEGVPGQPAAPSPPPPAPAAPQQ